MTATYRMPDGEVRRLDSATAKIYGFLLGQRLAAVHAERMRRRSRKDLAIADRCLAKYAADLGLNLNPPDAA